MEWALLDVKLFVLVEEVLGCTTLAICASWYNERNAVVFDIH
jgi:hypothetical protein